MSGIYQIRNTVNGRCYIGETGRPIDWRIFSHREALRTGKHPNRALQADWVNYGAEAFVFEIVEVMPGATKTERRAREKYYITAADQQLYNIEHCPADKRLYIDIEAQVSDPLLRKEEAAAILGLSPRQVQALAKNGQLPAVRISSQWRFERHKIEKFKQ